MALCLSTLRNQSFKVQYRRADQRSVIRHSIVNKRPLMNQELPVVDGAELIHPTVLF